MYNLFCVQSPLQLSSAILAAKKFNENKVVLIVTLSKGDRKINDSQIMDLIDFEFWDEVIFHKKGNILFKNILKFFRFKSLKKKYMGNIDKFFFGEFRDFDMALIGMILKPREKILLDDGAFTITAQNCYIIKNKSPFEKKLKKPKYKKYREFFVNNEVPNLFSFFDFNLIPGQKNYYEESFFKNDVIMNDNQIFFFGSKFSERKYMELKDELGVLYKVYKEYSKYEVFYIPHRDEEERKLKEIEKIGYKIKSLGKGAEIFFEETDVMPFLIISYFSTVLYTCHIKFNNVSIISLDVEDELKIDYWKRSAKSIYDYYRSIGINVVKP